MSTLIALILLAHFHLLGIVIAGLLLSAIVMFAAIAFIAGTQAFFNAQDRFRNWMTKKIARAGSWADKLVIGGMVAAPALIFAWTKLAH